MKKDNPEKAKAAAARKVDPNLPKQVVTSQGTQALRPSDRSGYQTSIMKPAGRE